MSEFGDYGSASKVRACSFRLPDMAKIRGQAEQLRRDEDRFRRFWEGKSLARALGLSSGSGGKPTKAGSLGGVALLHFVTDRACELDQAFPSLQLDSVSAERCVVMTQRQALTLICAAFLDIVPLSPPGFDSSHFTFCNMENTEMLKCVAVYLEATRQRMLLDPLWTGSLLSYSRRALPARALAQPEDWEALLSTPLVPMEVRGEGDIAFTRHCLQADFANEYVGGGTLCGGCVQEEIRFVLSPECLVSMLLCDRMRDDEAILIRGTESFSQYTGYASSFACAGPYHDPSPVDADGYRDSHVAALDALRLSVSQQQQLSQFNGGAMVRELRKCLAAVAPWPHEQQPAPSLQPGRSQHSHTGQTGAAGQAEEEPPKQEALRAFATGKWGCGVFGGDPQLKSVLQWLAVSVARRPVVFFPFSDAPLAAALAALVAAVGSSARPVSVGQLAAWACAYKGDVRRLREADRPSFFDFLFDKLGRHNS